MSDTPPGSENDELGPEFEEALLKLTQDQCVVIAERAALRVFPIHAASFKTEWDRASLLSHWRIFLLTSAQARPAGLDIVAPLLVAGVAARAAARAAAVDTAGAAASSAAMDTARAAAQAAGGSTTQALADEAAGAARAAARAAGAAWAARTARTDREAREAMEARTDLSLCLLRGNATRASLWTEAEVPEEIMKRLEVFEATAANSHWALMAQWYRHQLNGGYRTTFFDPAAEEQLITMPEAFWQRIAGTPDAVMADIEAIHQGREPAWRPDDTDDPEADDNDEADPQGEEPGMEDTAPTPSGQEDDHGGASWHLSAAHPILSRTEWVAIPDTPQTSDLVDELIASLRRIAQRIETENSFCDQVSEADCEILRALLRTIERQLAPDLICDGEDLGPPTSAQPSPIGQFGKKMLALTGEGLEKGVIKTIGLSVVGSAALALSAAMELDLDAFFKTAVNLFKTAFADIPDDTPGLPGDPQGG
ncbi:MAG: hypothetical protein AAF608_02360 [Pseudomonadota bacterium]